MFTVPRVPTALFARAVLITCLCAVPRVSHACAAPAPPGLTVSIADESAIIVWNAKTHTENFIRRAVFETKADNFGFLVPTPSPPQLSEVVDSAFDQLAGTFKPRIIRRPLYGLKVILLTGAKTRGTASTAEDRDFVDILNVQHVAGYDAVVLRAANANALAGWLKRHGYATSPALAKWLAPYVAGHWSITAFKLSKLDTDAQEVRSIAVRMTFTAERPFYPYSEPADQRVPGAYSADRLLRIYFLSDSRMEGSLDSADTTWPGAVRWALPRASLGGLFTSGDNLSDKLTMDASELPSNLWLTVFEDKSSPRPGVADLYFRPSSNQSTQDPPPVVWSIDERIGIPAELIVPFIGICSIVMIGRLLAYLRYRLIKHSQRLLKNGSSRIEAIQDDRRHEVIVDNARSSTE